MPYCTKSPTCGLQYRFDGKEKLLSFGKYPVVTLAIACEKRNEAKVLLDQGKDPAEVKKEKRRTKAALKLFEPIARAWHANRVDGLDLSLHFLRRSNRILMIAISVTLNICWRNRGI